MIVVRRGVSLAGMCSIIVMLPQFTFCLKKSGLIIRIRVDMKLNN